VDVRCCHGHGVCPADKAALPERDVRQQRLISPTRSPHGFRPANGAAVTVAPFYLKGRKELGSNAVACIFDIPVCVPLGNARLSFIFCSAYPPGIYFEFIPENAGEPVTFHSHSF